MYVPQLLLLPILLTSAVVSWYIYFFPWSSFNAQWQKSVVLLRYLRHDIC